MKPTFASVTSWLMENNPDYRDRALAAIFAAQENAPDIQAAREQARKSRGNFVARLTEERRQWITPTKINAIVRAMAEREGLTIDEINRTNADGHVAETRARIAAELKAAHGLTKHQAAWSVGLKGWSEKIQQVYRELGHEKA